MSSESEYFGGKPKFEKNKKYFDLSFKNNDESIFGKFDENWDDKQKKAYEQRKRDIKYEYFGMTGNELNKEVSWTRIFEKKDITFNENEGKKEGKLSLTQGRLGNCSIIAYIHCLQKESILFDSIISKCEPNEGYFEVNFYFEENEEVIRKKVYVDDYIPYKKIPYDYKKLTETYMVLNSLAIGRYLLTLNNTYKQFIEKSNEPLFSHYKDPEFNTFMVGTYLLIEKAYAKVKGCYMNIEGTDIAFALTGLKPKIKFLTDILLNYVKKVGENKYYEKKKKLEDEFYKKIISLRIEDDLYYKKREKIEEEYEKKIASLKEEIINEDSLDLHYKKEIFDELNEDLENNLVTLGTEKDIDLETYFGIWGNHRYDFLKCNYFNANFYFYLWNPHGKNDIYDKKFKEKNPNDKDELKNGELILNFNRLFLSFKRMIYQNKKELLEINKKYKTKSVLDILGIASPSFPPILNYLTYNTTFWLPFLWLRINKNKDKDNKAILSDLIDELHNIQAINLEQILWFYYLWNSMKPEIIKESEKIMKERIKNEFNNEKDLDKIINILITVKP